MTKKEINKLNQDFEVSSISRIDLTEFISEKEALKLSDSDMKRLANKMGDAINDICYWDVLEASLNYIKN